MPHYTEALLRERCALYRSELLGDSLATPQELDPYWPGGELNKLEDPIDAWTLAYARCFWLDGRRAGRDVERASREGKDERTRAVLAAQRATPEPVELVELLPDGARRVVYVHPKSAVALDEMRARELTLAQLIADTAAVEAALETPADLELVLRANHERVYLQHLLMWIAITPGPGLPYAWGEPAPDLPADHLGWTPADFYLVANAFQKVNAGRAAAMHSSGDSGSQPDFTGFFATLAIEMHTSTRALTRDYSILELIATAAEIARTREEQREAAKHRNSQTEAA